MKILFLHHVADMYGASQSLLRLTRARVRDGETVLVLLHEDGPLREALESAGVTVRLFPDMPVLHRSRVKSAGGILRLARQALVAGRKLDAIVREIRPDLIHVNTATILPVAGRVARRHGIPLIQHYRESFLCFGFLWSVYRRWLTRHATRVVSISDYLAGEFPPRQRAAIVRVARNGIPPEDIATPAPEDVLSFRERWKLHSPVIACIGRINPERKGQKTLIEAAAILRPRHPDAQYLIVGSPFPGNEHHLDTLKRLIREKGLEDRVVLTGHQGDVRPALANSVMTVTASAIPEGLGNVTIESMAMGIPVVGTRIGATPELIEDGVTGLVVPPADPPAMAGAIERILDDPALAASFGEAARKRFAEQLSYDAFHARIRAIYREAIEEARR